MDDRYESFDRARWAALRSSTPLTLSADDLDKVRGINDRLDLDEVANVYLPLSRLLNLHIAATQELTAVTDTFLNRKDRHPIPYLIGLAGSVAVGKSTAARVLQTLLSNWADHPQVDLITTDGFLFPNEVLEERHLLGRKGFPESYDTAALIGFLREVKSGEERVSAPVYSHLRYDIVAGEEQVVERPDVLIVEGLNVLQANRGTGEVFVSDFFDFNIYLDAKERDVKAWYIERFLTLRDSVFTNPESYFRNYATLDEPSAISVASSIWDDINGPNLHENIAPTKMRADLIMRKGADHAVRSVRLRKA